MTQQILSIDSQILNSIQSCARKTQYSFIENIQPETKAEALENGSLVHDMLEVYYSLQLDSGPNFESEIWKDIRESGITISLKEPSVLAYKNSAIKVGNLRASRMNLDADEVNNTIYHFSEYCDYFQHDSWHPLAVEEVGSKVLYETEDLKIIYNFKIDLIAEQGNIIAPFDHKTSKRRSEPSSLSNQFIGYCYGLGLNNIVINKIGFQKTLKPKERFLRYILPISNERISEWIENTVYWARVLLHSKETGHWPMNLTSCDKYSGCIFASVCESDPDSRLYNLERNFKVGEAWDVAGVLEDK